MTTAAPCSLGLCARSSALRSTNSDNVNEILFRILLDSSPTHPWIEVDITCTNYSNEGESVAVFYFHTLSSRQLCYYWYCSVDLKSRSETTLYRTHLSENITAIACELYSKMPWPEKESTVSKVRTVFIPTIKWCARKLLHEERVIVPAARGVALLGLFYTYIRFLVLWKELLPSNRGCERFRQMCRNKKKKKGCSLFHH